MFYAPGGGESRKEGSGECKLSRSTTDVVIIGLGLFNEGLFWAESEAVDSFLAGLKRLVKMIEDIGAVPIIADCYPCNLIQKPSHYELLVHTHNVIQSWEVLSFNWFDALDDGKGHFKPGMLDDMTNDPVHPNDVGHTCMFNAIPKEWFTQIQAKL